MSPFIREYVIPLFVAVVAGLIVLRFSSAKRKWIWATVVVLSVLAGAIYFWDKSRKPDEPLDRVIAGTTIDAATQASISGAVISVVGRKETCTSESTGKFRIQLQEASVVPDFVLLHVEKQGFKPYEESVRPGVHDFEVQLQKATK